MMASTEVDDVVHWEPHLVMTPPCTSFGGHHLTGMILMLLGSISWDLVLIANVFPLLGRTGISRISSCLFNYIHRIDCTLVWTRNQTSKNTTVGKLDLPNELCQTCEHMHWDAIDNILFPKCLVKISLS